ncbi:MAG: hypothetical protein AAGA31_00040 [Bacteroidota bacterium]
MKYELIGLQEHGMFVTLPQGGEDRKGYKINWSFDLGIKIPKDGQIAIRIDTKINVTQPEGHPTIGHFAATHFFSATDLPQSITDSYNQDMFNFMATLVGISLGSMRGLAYARTFNVYGGAVFMPVVNPSELLKSQLPKVLSEMSTLRKS